MPAIPSSSAQAEVVSSHVTGPGAMTTTATGTAAKFRTGGHTDFVAAALMRGGGVQAPKSKATTVPQSNTTAAATSDTKKGGTMRSTPEGISDDFLGGLDEDELFGLDGSEIFDF